MRVSIGIGLRVVGPLEYHDCMVPDVAVVIVTYNSAHVIGQLLDSLPAALAGLKANVVVVDNASADATVEVLGSREDCRLIRSTNVGYSAGINLGVRVAGPAEAILVLNPDVILHPGSVRPLLESVQRPGVGIAAPKTLGEDGSLEYSLRRTPSLLRAAGLNWTRLPIFSEFVTAPQAYRTSHEFDWAAGAALMVSRPCHDALGGWDESFFLYSEDTQLCLDARRSGFRTCYVPQSVVVHLRGQSGTSSATHAMMVINRVRLYRRRKGALAAWCYYCLCLLSELSWVARGRSCSWFAIKALLRPPLRPSALGCSTRLLPS